MPLGVTAYLAATPVHGDCIGADIEAATIALESCIGIFTVYPQNTDSKKRAWFLNPKKIISNETAQYIETLAPTEIYPDSPRYIKVKWMPAKAPLERNQDIVNASSILLAAPKEFSHTVRSGTWATIRRAWQKQRLNKTFNVVIIPPKE